MERARTSVGTERPCLVCGGLRGGGAKEVRCGGPQKRRFPRGLGGGRSTRRQAPLCKGREAGIWMTCLGILSRFVRMERERRMFSTLSHENSGGWQGALMAVVTWSCAMSPPQAALRRCHGGLRAEAHRCFSDDKGSEPYGGVGVKTRPQALGQLGSSPRSTAVGCWTRYLTTLCLDFLICKMGITQASASLCCWESLVR